MSRLQEQQAQRQATAEHRQREDEAPRLRREVPNLSALRMRFDDLREEGRLVIASYARPIVVDSAPAHFEIRCMEARCTGRHDLTYEILHALRQSRVSFDGTSHCYGMVGERACDRVLGYACEAIYRSAP